MSSLIQEIDLSRMTYDPPPPPVDAAAYLSPEQARGEPVPASTDVFALGVMAYEILAERRPFVGDSPMSVALQIVQAEPAPLPPEVSTALLFLHSRRTPDLLEAAIENEYHVVTMDGESLLDAGFAALYLNGETDYAIARKPREELQILGGNIYLHGSGEQRWA